MLELADRWIWDFWLTPGPVTGRWHVFFLQAPRTLGDPDRRHEHASIGHATSDDLVTWTDVGDALGAGLPGTWDDRATWTGSVVAGPDRRWWLFYTGTTRAEQGLVQRVGAATSDDLSTWTKLAGPLVEADARWYERYDPRLGQDGLADTAGYSEAWRDPWVIADPDGDGWLMLTTARRPFGRPEGRGVIGVARSTDLRSWQVGPPIVAGDEFGQFEVPQLLRIAGRWAIVFCLASANHAPGRHERGAPIWTGNGVMVADDLAGPWHVCDEPYLGAPHYAARIVERDGRLLALSWLDVVDGAFSGVLADPVDVTERLTAMVSRA